MALRRTKTPAWGYFCAGLTIAFFTTKTILCLIA